MNYGICRNCKLRVSDYCFCLSEPEKLNNKITNCNYHFDDKNSTYYEFIDGYQHALKHIRKER